MSCSNTKSYQNLISFSSQTCKNSREDSKLYKSLTAFDVIKLGFQYLHKQKKVEKNSMTLVVNLLYTSYN